MAAGSGKLAIRQSDTRGAFRRTVDRTLGRGNVVQRYNLQDTRYKIPGPRYYLDVVQCVSGVYSVPATVNSRLTKESAVAAIKSESESRSQIRIGQSATTHLAASRSSPKSFVLSARNNITTPTACCCLCFVFFAHSLPPIWKSRNIYIS